MNRDWLRSFAAFAEVLNFTAAARRLGLSQPALHVQIKKLAAEIGRPLYHRRGREIELTGAGERLAVYARDLARRESELLSELADVEPPVVLAAGQGAVLHLLGDAIRRFDPVRRSLRLLIESGPAALEALAGARADLAVAGAARTGLPSTRLARVGLVVALPRKHALASRKRLSAADLAGEPIIAPPSGPHRQRLAAAFAAAGAQLEVAVEASGWSVMLGFVRLGLGLAVVNDFCAMPPGTVAVELRGLPPIDYHLYWRPELTGPARRLRDLISGGRPAARPRS